MECGGRRGGMGGKCGRARKAVKYDKRPRSIYHQSSLTTLVLNIHRYRTLSILRPRLVDIAVTRTMVFCNGCFIDFSKSGLQSHLRQTKNPQCRQIYFQLRQLIPDDSFDAVADELVHSGPLQIDNADIPSSDLEIERHIDLGDGMDLDEDIDDLGLFEDEEDSDKSDDESVADGDEDRDRSHEFWCVVTVLSC